MPKHAQTCQSALDWSGGMAKLEIVQSKRLIAYDTWNFNEQTKIIADPIQSELFDQQDLWKDHTFGQARPGNASNTETF